MTQKRAKKSASVISILARAGFFAEDKDAAATVRETCIRPAINAKKSVVLDFSGVVGATQSFVHALIAAVIREDGSNALDLLEFRGCNPSIKGVISIVVDYCQLDVAEDEAEIRERPKPTDERK
jgi:hypothetical protein